jgi:hypothetical protein
MDGARGDDWRLGSESNRLSKCLLVRHFSYASNRRYPVRYPADYPDSLGLLRTMNAPSTSFNTVRYQAASRSIASPIAPSSDCRVLGRRHSMPNSRQRCSFATLSPQHRLETWTVASGDGRSAVSRMSVEQHGNQWTSSVNVHGVMPTPLTPVQSRLVVLSATKSDSASDDTESFSFFGLPVIPKKAQLRSPPERPRLGT